MSHVAAAPKPGDLRGRRLKHSLAMTPNGYLASLLGWLAALLVTVATNGPRDSLRRHRKMRWSGTFTSKMNPEPRQSLGGPGCTRGANVLYVILHLETSRVVHQ
jgi:hypothetical protein